MKILRTHFQQWAVFLVLSLAVTGYPLHGQAMSLFMGGEEPKATPPPPKPVAAKPQSASGQPGPKPTPPIGAPGDPARQVSPSPAAGAPSPAAPSAGVGVPKPGGSPPPMQPTVPAPIAQGSPSPTSSVASAPKSAAVQPSAPAVQASGALKELPKPAASTGAPATPTTPAMPPTAAAKAPALVEVAEGYTYDPKSRRDPFQSLTRLIKIDKTRAEMPPLQRVQISDLKLLGIMWGGYGYYGLVQTPDGKGYTVKEGMLMGTNNGVITTITDKAIIVSEPGVDVTGKKSTKDVELLLRPKEVS